MKRYLSLFFVLVLAFGILAGCSSSDANTNNDPANEENNSSSGEAEYELILGTTCSDPALAPDWNCFGHNIAKFVELVEEYSDGRIVVTPYWQSVLGGDTELFQSLVDGEIDFYFGNGFATADPRFAWTGLPFIWKSTEQIEELFANPEGELYLMNQEIYNEHGVMNLGQGIGTARGVANSEHPVRVPSDLNDLIVRTYEDIMVNTFFGGLCTISILPASEMYTAIQTGTVTGSEFPDGVYLRDGYDELVPYFTYLNWQVSMYAMKCNKAMYDSLPEDLQTLLVETSIEVGQETAADVMTEADEAEKAMVEAGMTIVEPDLAPFKAAVDPVYEKLGYAELRDKLYKEIGKTN